MSISAHKVKRQQRKPFLRSKPESTEVDNGKGKTVDSALREKNVTPEEEKQLREIIEECRAREAEIKQASEAAR